MFTYFVYFAVQFGCKYRTSVKPYINKKEWNHRVNLSWKLQLNFHIHIHIRFVHDNHASVVLLPSFDRIMYMIFIQNKHNFLIYLQFL